MYLYTAKLVSCYTLLFKRLGSARFFFKEEKLILLFSKKPLNWSKVTVKTSIMLQKIFLK